MFPRAPGRSQSAEGPRPADEDGRGGRPRAPARLRRRRLTELVRANSDEDAADLVGMIFEDVRAWAHGRAPYDDQTVVVLKIV